MTRLQLEPRQVITKFYRDGNEVPIERVLIEMRDSARDAGVDVEVATAIVAGALAGDECDRESVEAFTFCVAVDAPAERGQLH
jgi:hypothetical protein